MNSISDLKEAFDYLYPRQDPESAMSDERAEFAQDAKKAYTRAALPEYVTVTAGRGLNDEATRHARNYVKVAFYKAFFDRAAQGFSGISYGDLPTGGSDRMGAGVSYGDIPTGGFTRDPAELRDRASQIQEYSANRLRDLVENGDRLVERLNQAAERSLDKSGLSQARAK